MTYKTTAINNRRYLGNKYKLLPFISKVVNENCDANEIYADIVYLDPPYNSRQYCDAYHLLENVAKWEKPEVKGVARKMDRKNLKSNYCTTLATKTFEDLIAKLNCKYIHLSYNNMSNKGNERSNAKISVKDILRFLKANGHEYRIKKVA